MVLLYYITTMSEVSSGEFTASIIGAGRVGEYHISAQERLGSDIVIYEPDAERAHGVVREHGGEITVARTLEEAVELADVVHVCTPHNLHAEGAMESIRQGKPAIVEKPLTIKLDEAVDVYRAARLADVPVMVGTSFRLTPPFMEVYKGLRAGKIGELISLETTYLHDMGRVTDGLGWRQSPDRGSFLYGGGSHAVDLNMWLADQPVTEVQARVSTKEVRPQYPGEEDFDLALGYEDGTTGRVWLSAAAPLPQHGADVKVYGSDGAYRAHNKNPVLDTYIDGEPDWRSEHIGLSYTIDDMSALFNAYVRGERQDFSPMPDIEDGLRVMMVLRALDEASRSGSVEKVPGLPA